MELPLHRPFGNATHAHAVGFVHNTTLVPSYDAAEERGYTLQNDFSPVNEQRIRIQNGHGETLVGVLHETGSKELAILCHGFQSSKERKLMLNLAVALEKQGISAFRFDFTGNGESEGLFRYGNYHKEAEELRAVVLYFHRQKRLVATIIGHSKGGNVVLLYASKYKDVHAVVNISGRFYLERGIDTRLGKDYLQRIEENGFVDVYNQRGKFEYRVTMDNLMDRLTTDVIASCQAIEKECRVLTIHGSEDATVPVEEAFEFARNIANHRLHIISGADHEFTSHQHELAASVLDFCTMRCTSSCAPSRL